MSDLLKKDSTIKILSILFAIVLWFVVNPIGTRTISVPLTIKGEEALKDKNIILKSKNIRRTIDVVIKGNEERIKNVSGFDFEAVLDFSKINSPDERTVSIDGPIYKGKEEGIIIKDVLQKSVDIDLERLERNSFSIDVKQTGNPKAGYKVVNVTTSPDTITLQGSDSLIGSIDSIKTVISINNIDRDTVLKKQVCKVYDKNGKEITELSRNLTVDVNVQVAKEVGVSLVVKGKPAANYADGERRVTPEKVLITGPAAVLAKITELKTEPVNIENVRNSIETVSMLILPPGVELVDMPREVAVSVIIEPLAEKEFLIQASNISIENAGTESAFNFGIKTEGITVKVRGPKLELSGLSIGTLKPSADVAGIKEEGVHKVPVKFNLPGNIKLVQQYFIEINAEKIQTGVTE